MTNREKLIEILTEENDDKAKVKEIYPLLIKSPFGYSCPSLYKCEDVGDQCAVCAEKWLNEEAKE